MTIQHNEQNCAQYQRSGMISFMVNVAEHPTVRRFDEALRPGDRARDIISLTGGFA